MCWCIKKLKGFILKIVYKWNKNNSYNIKVFQNEHYSVKNSTLTNEENVDQIKDPVFHNS